MRVKVLGLVRSAIGVQTGTGVIAGALTRLAATAKAAFVAPAKIWQVEDNVLLASSARCVFLLPTVIGMPPHVPAIVNVPIGAAARPAVNPPMAIVIAVVVVLLGLFGIDGFADCTVQEVLVRL